MTTPSLDEVFGNYRLTHLLGKGGMASVYRAVRSGPMGFAKQVAIKRLHPSLTRDSAILKALVNEARIGGQLKHPNIVEIYEFNRVGDTYYLAMEFIDGWTLDRVIQLGRDHQQQLPKGVALDMAIQVCEGLHYAHTLESLEGVEVHLVHRDLKPANIIVGRDGVTKIMDFGIAKADTNLFKTTLVDTTKGTPHYMSPEQVGGDPQLGASSDIFAMGSLLYELATEKILFQGDSLASVLFAVSRAEVDEQIEEVEAILPGLGPIVGRCLEREPNKRFPSAKALQQALLQLQKSREAEPWTTKNFMYTLRSKLLEERVRSEPRTADEEMDFAPLISNPGLSLTDEVDVEETRAAADAEISKLQSQYLSEAMTQTVAVAVLEEDEPAFPQTMVSAESVSADLDAKPGAPNHKVLVALLAVTLFITFGVVLYRALSEQPAGKDSTQATSASTAAEPSAVSSSPAPLPTPAPSAAKPLNQPKARPPTPTPAAKRKPIESDAPRAVPEQVAATAQPVAAASPAPVVAAAAAKPAAEAPLDVIIEPPGIGALGVRASTPSSVVYVDEERVGKTPLMPIELAAGEHIVRLECATDGIKASKTIPVNIEVGKTLKLGKYDFTTQEWK